MLKSDDLRLPRREIKPRPSGFREVASTAMSLPLPGVRSTNYILFWMISNALFEKNLKHSYSNLFIIWLYVLALLVANCLLILIYLVLSNRLGSTANSASSSRASGCSTDSTWKSTRICQTSPRRSANVDESSQALSPFSSCKTVQYRWTMSSLTSSQSIYHWFNGYMHHAPIVIHWFGWKRSQMGIELHLSSVFAVFLERWLFQTFQILHVFCRNFHLQHQSVGWTLQQFLHPFVLSFFTAGVTDFVLKDSERTITYFETFYFFNKTFTLCNMYIRIYLLSL